VGIGVERTCGNRERQMVHYLFLSKSQTEEKRGGIFRVYGAVPGKEKEKNEKRNAVQGC
jgi:hypothetical protein